MSKPSPVSHLVFAQARTGCSAQLGERLSGLIEPTLMAPGCLQFSLQQSMQDPNLWLVSGLWSSEQAMNAYFSTPALGIFAEVVQELMISSLDFHTFNQVSAAQADIKLQQPLHKLVG